jgi:hypothetical protein
LHDAHGQALRMSPRGQRRTLLGRQDNRRGQMHMATIRIRGTYCQGIYDALH